MAESAAEGCRMQDPAALKLRPDWYCLSTGVNGASHCCDGYCDVQCVSLVHLVPYIWCHVRVASCVYVGAAILQVKILATV
jgi:hypothetical protein